MYFKKNIGGLGEKVSAEYLEKNNYKVIYRNFNSRFGEIDLIAKDKDELVFIEVKTRRSLKYGMPSEAINNQKLKHIKETAKYYLYKTKQEDLNIRFDAIEVYLGNGNYRINHIKQII